MNRVITSEELKEINTLVKKDVRVEEVAMQVVNMATTDRKDHN